MPNNFRECPWDRREFPGPIGKLVRPAEPGGFVTLPFGGHSKAKGLRCAGLRQCLHRGKESNTGGTENGGGRTIPCPTNDSGLAGTHQYGGRAETANCGACLRFLRGRTRQRESVPCRSRLRKEPGRRDRRQTN